jgi:hypothetical protein
MSVGMSVELDNAFPLLRAQGKHRIEGSARFFTTRYKDELFFALRSLRGF